MVCCYILAFSWFLKLWSCSGFAHIAPCGSCPCRGIGVKKRINKNILDQRQIIPGQKKICLNRKEGGKKKRKQESNKGSQEGKREGGNNNVMYIYIILLFNHIHIFT